MATLKYGLPIFILTACGSTTHAQISGAEKGEAPSEKFKLHQDTALHNLADYFTHGESYGRVRNHTMATFNEGELKDYWTNAFGGIVGFQTAQWYGLQLGASASFSFNTFSNDLNELDSLVNKSAKWEKELYDANRPNEKKDLARLDELFARFTIGKSFVQVGRMDLNRGPLFLNRDGRMRPFVYRGAWLEMNEFSKNKLTLGWIDGVGGRPITEWHSLNQAIGMNSNGIQPDGSKANYNTTSHIRGIATVGYQNSNIKNLELSVWNFYFDRQFNLLWLQADYKSTHLLAGLQYAHQETLDYQAQLAYENRYVQPENKGQVLSGLLGYKNESGTWQVSAIYLHSFDSGRFLYPRELGRENFYASQPRSWVDGFGGSDIYMMRLKTSHKGKWGNALVVDTRLSRTETPGLGNLELNKYNLASFYQATVMTTYHFGKRLEGLEASLVYIGKYTEKSAALSASDTFYKTNLHHVSLMVDIHI